MLNQTMTSSARPVASGERLKNCSMNRLPPKKAARFITQAPA